MALGHWHEQAIHLKDNRERRKYMFRTYHRWRGRGSSRQRIEKCVEIGVRIWFPSKAYMGYYDNNDRSVCKRAVDIFGNDIDAWWVYGDDGWVLEEI